MKFIFGNCVLDASRRELRRADQLQPIEPRAFDLLEFLLRHRDRVISKDELFAAVWNGRNVSDSALTTRINAVRAALSDNGRDQRLIKTYVGKGLRFVGDVQEVLPASGKFDLNPEGLPLSRDELPRLSPAPITPPSIAVLPFIVAGDGLTEYFGDGIVEDIILSLASLRELFVVSRGSTLSFRRSEMTPSAIGEALGVRYIVAGRVHRVGEALRVWIELSDSTTAQTIWTNKIDCGLTALFEVQDQIVAGTVSRIAPEIRYAELKRALRKRPESLSAYDYLLRALDLINRLERNSFDAACKLLKHSRELDQAYALSQAWSAWTHMFRVALGWSEDEKWDIAEATRLAETALHLDDRNARALATFGHLSAYFKRDHETALHYLDQATTSCPNDPFCWALSSATSSYVSRGAEAISKAQRAMGLSPFDKFRFYYTAVLALAYYVTGQYEEAVRWGRVAMSENEGFTPNLRYLVAALAASGELKQARQVAGLLMKKQPNFTLRHYEEAVLPFRDAKSRKLHLSHLRVALLRER